MAGSSSLKRFAAEGALIVLSILVAFWIDAWWDERQESLEELALLDVLEIEVQANRAELAVIIEDTESVLDRVDRFFRSDAASLSQLPQDSTGLWMTATYSPRTFDPDLTAAEVLLSRPFPSSKRASDVRPIVAELVRMLEDSEEEKAAMREAAVAVIGLLSASSTSALSDGVGPIFEIAARLGPELLGDLRDDPVLMGHVAEKAHFQQIYLRELEPASALLDSLSAVLSTGS